MLPPLPISLMANQLGTRRATFNWLPPFKPAQRTVLSAQWQRSPCIGNGVRSQTPPAGNKCEDRRGQKHDRFLVQVLLSFDRLSNRLSAIGCRARSRCPLSSCCPASSQPPWLYCRRSSAAALGSAPRAPNRNPRIHYKRFAKCALAAETTPCHMRVTE